VAERALLLLAVMIPNSLSKSDGNFVTTMYLQIKVQMESRFEEVHSPVSFGHAGDVSKLRNLLYTERPVKNLNQQRLPSSLRSRRG
jgi:hypothetical protein